MVTRNESEFWFRPEHCRLAIELFERVVTTLESTQYASMRKDVRHALDRVARECSEFIHLQRVRPPVEGALLRALDRIAAEKGREFQQEVIEAIEKHVSDFNRPSNRRR